MDWGQGQAQGQGLTSTASMMPAMGGQAAPTHTNTSHTSMTNPEKEKEKKSSKSKGKDKEKGSDKPAEKAKSSSGSKKSSGGHVWLPLANGKQVDVFYSASIAGNDPTHSSYPLISTRPPSQSFLLIHNLNPLHQSTSSNPSSHIPSHPPTQPTLPPPTHTGSTATITLRAVNNAKDGSAVAVTATFSSNPSMRPATPSASNLRLSQQLPAGKRVDDVLITLQRSL